MDNLNKYGFIQTPYRKVDRGWCRNQRNRLLTADEEDEFIVAQANF